MYKGITRRALLRSAALSAAASAVAACQPKVVEVEKVVTQVVKETVVVEGTPQVVEKEITRVVEKEVQAAPKEHVVVTIQSFSDNVPGMQDCYETFNASQDWVTAEVTKITYDKMYTMIAANTCPDLMRIDAMQFAEVMPGGVFASYQPYLDAEGLDFDWAYDVLKPWLGWPVGEEVHIMPYRGGPFVCFYNKDHFDEAGIPYPADDWTWNDYLETAQKLTKMGSDGMPIRYGSFNYPKFWWNSWLCPLFQAGGVPYNHPDWKFADFTDPDFLSQTSETLPGYSADAMKQSLQFNHDLVYEFKACARPGFELPEGVGFLTGNESMTIQNTDYAWSIIKGQKVTHWGAVQPPRAPHEKGRHGTQAYIVGWAMAANSPHMDAVWEAAKFQYSVGGRKCFWDKEMWGWSEDLEEWILTTAGIDESYAKIFEFAKGKDSIFVAALPQFGPFFNEALHPLAEKVYVDEMTPEEAVPQMIEAGNEVLGR